MYLPTGVVVLTALLSSALAQTYTVKGPADYSARCNDTLNLFNNDPAVVACAQMEIYFSDAYNTFRTNASQLTTSVNRACAATSPEQACTAAVVAKITAGINGDCANEILNSDPTSAINRYARSLTFSGVYQQTLCATDSVSGFCVADFFATFSQWPTSYSIMVGTKLDLFAGAAGDLTPTLSNVSAFYLCTACSSREYSYVFAFVENVLRNSSTLSTTQVGLPGPNPIGTDEQTSLNYISKMNASISSICHSPFLTFTVAVPPPPPTSANHTSATAKPTTSGSATSPGSMTVSSGANATGTMTTTSATAHSAASGIQSTASFSVLLGVMAILAAMAL